jgi:hypothetical protein
MILMRKPFSIIVTGDTVSFFQSKKNLAEKAADPTLRSMDGFRLVVTFTGDYANREEDQRRNASVAAEGMSFERTDDKTIVVRSMQPIAIALFDLRLIESRRWTLVRVGDEIRLTPDL